MGNAFGAGPNNEAPHGRDVTVEDRKSERSHSGAPNMGPEVKSVEELRRGRPASPPVRRSLFGEQSLEDAGREASRRSADLFSPTLVPTSPLDSAYEPGRKTPLCCLVEPDTNTPDEAGVVFETAKTCRTAKKREQKRRCIVYSDSPQQRTKEQKQLTYGTSKDSDSEEKSPTRTPTKKATSSLRIRSRSSPMKEKTVVGPLFDPLADIVGCRFWAHFSFL